MKQRVPREVVAQAAIELLKQGESTGAIAQSLAEYIVLEGRTRELESILRHMDDYVASEYGLREVQVASAHELTDTVRRSVVALFSGDGTVRLHEELDPDLVGGIRLRAQDRVLDVSVKTQLRQMKQQIKV